MVIFYGDKIQANFMIDEYKTIFGFIVVQTFE